MRLRLLALIILAASSLSLQAATIYSTSFEQPTFFPGMLAGQDGFDAGGTPVAQVVTGISHSGSQSVAFNATGTAEQNIITVAQNFTPTPGNETVNVQIAAMFTNADDPYSVFDVISLFSSNNFIEQLLYSNGEVSFGGGSLLVAPDVWNVYDLNLDFATQMAMAYMNGNYIGSSTFYNPAQDLHLVQFGLNGIDGPGTAIGYFDDFSVSTVTPSQVPEPSSLVLLGTGILGLAGIARRKFIS